MLPGTLAHPADHDARDEDRQHVEVAEVQLGRQQDVEGAGDRQEVEHPAGDLEQRAAGPRQDEAAAADRERPVEEGAPDDVGADERQRGAGSRAPRQDRQAGRGGEPVGVDQQHDPGQRRDAEREGGGVEDLDLGDIEDGDAAPGVELVAQRGADDEAEAGRVRDRLGDEGAERQVAQRHLAPDQPHGADLVAHQGEEAQGGVEDRLTDLAGAEVGELALDLAEAVARERAVEHEQRHGEDRRPHDERQRLPPAVALGRHGRVLPVLRFGTVVPHRVCRLHAHSCGGSGPRRPTGRRDRAILPRRPCAVRSRLPVAQSGNPSPPGPQRRRGDLPQARSGRCGVPRQSMPLSRSSPSAATVVASLITPWHSMASTSSRAKARVTKSCSSWSRSRGPGRRPAARKTW